MRISKITKNPEKSYIYMERYVNDGSPSGFSKNTTSPLTQPLSNHHSFMLQVVKFDDSIKVVTVGASPYDDLPEQCILCHPDNLVQDIMVKNKEHWSVVGEVEVAPTASGRTVKCVGDKKFFVKLDYAGMLGRIQRNLDLQRIQSANEVTGIIKEAILAGKMNDKFGLLLEDFGRVAYLPAENGTFYEMGYILRDNNIFSKQHNDEALHLIPAFSLFSKDRKCLLSTKLLVQMYKKQEKNVYDFLYEDLLKPIVDTYFDVLTNCGLCLEAHAQNILVAIDDQYRLRYVVVRDMESVDKDLPLRDYLKLSNDVIKATTYKCLRETDYNYQIKHSFMYDFKLGVYLLDPILNTFSARCKKFDANILIDKIKQLANERAKALPKDYFPKVWYDYANIIHDQEKKRPYQAHDDVRYR